MIIKLRKKQLLYIFTVGTLFWLFDAVIDNLIYKHFSLAGSFSFSGNEFFLRSLTMLVIMVAGVMIGIYSNRLTESEGRYRQLFDNLNDAIFITPAFSSVQDAKIVEANTEASLLLGYDLDELRQFSLADLAPAANRPGLSAMIQRLQVEKHALYKTVQVAKDGSQIPVEIHAHLVDLLGRPAIMSLVRNITERQQAENALLQSEARFRAIFDGAAIGMAVVDLEGRFVAANPACQKDTGYPEAALIGKHVSELSFPGDPDPELEMFAALATGKLDHYQIEKRFQGKEGQVIWGNLTVSLVRDPEGRPQFAIGMVEDITARKGAEDALRQAHAELERRVLERTTELALTNLDLQFEVEERRTAEAALRQSKEQLQALTSQLLDAQEAERRRISLELHDELGQALLLLKFKFSALFNKSEKKSQTLKKDYDLLLHDLDGIIENVRRLALDLSPSILEELGLSSALRFLLEQVGKYSAINLSSLDIDGIDGLFTPHTEVNIYRIFQESLTNIVRHSQARKISIAIKRQGDKVFFTVEDDGSGFDVDKILGREASRRGLGLAAIQERLRIEGGEFKIQSQEGAGTRISFSLPIPPGGMREAV
jgi:two-component system sensor histidine kinase UhpB